MSKLIKVFFLVFLMTLGSSLTVDEVYAKDPGGPGMGSIKSHYDPGDLGMG